MKDYDVWLSELVEGTMEDCKRIVGVHQEPQDGEIASEPIYSCEECDNKNCEYWKDFHDLD